MSNIQIVYWRFNHTAYFLVKYNNTKSLVRDIYYFKLGADRIICKKNIRLILLIVLVIKSQK